MPSSAVEPQPDPHESKGDGDPKNGVGPGKGFLSFLRRLWYYVEIIFIGEKWMIKEMLMKHKKLSVEELSKINSSGKTVVITGGARGIGAEVVKQCLQQDMKVIIGCRKPSAGDALVKQYRDQGVVTGTAEALPLDLNSLSSVRLFAQSILNKNIPINLLINNAGVMFHPFQITSDGYVSQFQTNYLSHFLLTMQLLPALNSGGSPDQPSRVVNVSSVAQYGGQIDFNDIDNKYLHSPHKLYMSSKLMQVISSIDLSRRFQDGKLNVRVYSLHPGVIRTDLYNNLWFSNLLPLINALFKTAEQGADGIMFVATSPLLINEGGTFYINCRQRPVHPLALNQEVQQDLYTASRAMCGLSKNDNLAENLAFRVNEK